MFVLFASYAALGIAQAGRPNAYLPLTGILVTIAGFLIFSVACNDLADEAIDRVNLPGDRRRPLVGGDASRTQLSTTGIIGAIAALAASAALGWLAVLVVAVGLVLSAAYSLRPFRFAERGVLAPLVLPACYVAVPFLLGVDAAHRPVTSHDFVLLGGLYLGFIGRIVLKDFRDVRGDALFGKRTFLVRHGRRATCALSMICWSAGSLIIVIGSTRDTSEGLVADAILGVLAACSVKLINMLSHCSEHRRDERLISAIAILGRGMIVVLLAEFSIYAKAVAPTLALPLLLLLALLTLSQTAAMVVYGPRPRRSDVDRLLSEEPTPVQGLSRA
ncbi:UbiA family prenyltransferase [Actinospica robiniae]|uniref:UbiA family prenyltransferase n=1 Tax=Actinospica robiniae TaxID=304901 RepID=UPI00146FB8BB|nr:UbiA family prenyltransferase [Actinospica robiniae]